MKRSMQNKLVWAPFKIVVIICLILFSLLHNTKLGSLIVVQQIQRLKTNFLSSNLSCLFSPPGSRANLTKLLGHLLMTLDRDPEDKVQSIFCWVRQTFWYNAEKDKGLGIFERVPYGDKFIAAGITLLLATLIRRGVRRYRTATDIPTVYIEHGKPLRGYIISVNDSDNVRFHHNRFLSWGKPAVNRSDIKNNTINVRLAGIDAPEMGHFGGSPQPYAEDAKKWLINYTLGRKASIIVHRLDQYSRAVATVYVQRWGLLRTNVSLAMVEAGYATVYTSAGAEYGDIKEKLIKAEVKARHKRRGMWQQHPSEYTSPADYKRQLRSGVIRAQ